MKRYLVFAHADYYPRGGWNDLQGSADTLEEVEAIVARALDHEGRYQEWSASPDDDHSVDHTKFDEIYVIDLATGERLEANDLRKEGVIAQKDRQIATLHQIITDLHAIMRREGWQA